MLFYKTKNFYLEEGFEITSYRLCNSILFMILLYL